MRRVALYGRVSSAEQSSPDKTSIEKQLEAGRKEVERMNSFGVESEVVMEYQDEGVSGATSMKDRPQGLKLLMDAKRGMFDAVVFFSLDRFTRSATKGLADFEEMEDKLGLTLVFARENIDTSQPSGRLFRTILAAFSEFERETIRDRNMAGRFGKAKKGLGWATGQAPFGYKVVDGQLEIVEEEAEVVRRMFTMRANGSSLPVIARTLNDLGLKPRIRKDRRSGEVIPSSFTAGAIGAYLKAEYYKGVPIVRTLSQSKGGQPESFEFPVPEIVTERLWNAAQLTTMTPVEGAGEERFVYALSGRLFHVHTDDSIATVYGQSRKVGRNRDGGSVRFYRCSASRRSPQTGQAPYCTGMGEGYGHELTAVQSDWIEGQTLLWILDMLSGEGVLSAMMTEKDGEEADLGNEVYETLKDRQNNLRARMERWAEQYAEGVIDKATRNERLGALQAELDIVEEDLGRLQHKSAMREELNVTIKQLMEARIASDGDASGDEDNVPEIGTEQWWTEARVLATHSTQVGKFNRSPMLPSWLIEDVRFLATRLDLEVYITRADPGMDRPDFYIGFDGPKMLAPQARRPDKRQSAQSLLRQRESQEAHELTASQLPPVRGSHDTHDLGISPHRTPPLPVIPGRRYFVSGPRRGALTSSAI
jgi:DNA invertase Pin-like site-specific DNA recombinase